MENSQEPVPVRSSRERIDAVADQLMCWNPADDVAFPIDWHSHATALVSMVDQGCTFAALLEQLGDLRVSVRRGAADVQADQYAALQILNELGVNVGRAELAAAWIQHMSRPDREEETADAWAFGYVFDLCLYEPDAAWDFIVEALRQDTANVVVETLSAGPLEDLLRHHGPEVIERVEREARQNPRFAYLLGGVWTISIPFDIGERVQAVWDRRGWDGIPFE